MTPAERENPKMINGSRRLRIANGSGVKVNEVNQLVDRFFEARKMMGQMGGMMPGHAQALGDQVVEEQAQEREGQEGRPRPDPAAHARRLPGRLPRAGHAAAGMPRWRPRSGTASAPSAGMDDLPDISKSPKFPSSSELLGDEEADTRGPVCIRVPNRRSSAEASRDRPRAADERGQAASPRGYTRHRTPPVRSSVTVRARRAPVHPGRVRYGFRCR